MEETSIINSLCKKTNVMKNTLNLQVDEGILFPAEYKQCEELEIDEDNFNFREIPKIEDFTFEEVISAKDGSRTKKLSFKNSCTNLRPVVKSGLFDF
jgi:hypothetical protein